MDRVTGLDLSLASTRIAVVTQRADGSCLVTTTAITTTKGRRGDPLPARSERICAMAEEIVDAITSPLLVVLDDFPHGPMDQGLWWAVVHRLVQRKIPTAVCSSKVRTQWATGRDDADKASVAAAVVRMWPQVDLGRSDDRCDGLAMATMGAQRRGWAIPVSYWHIESLAAVTWPEGLPPLPAAA